MIPFETSAATELIERALLKVQAELPVIKETSKGAHNTTYADLLEILKVVMPLFNKHGIHFSQHPCSEAGAHYIITRFATGGQWMQSSLCIHDFVTAKQNGNTLWEWGGAVSYCCRYVLKSALGIATEDNDGQKNSTFSKPVQKTAPADPNEPCITIQQREELTSLLASASNGEKLRQDVYRFNSIKDLGELRASKFMMARGYINNNKVVT